MDSVAEWTPTHVVRRTVMQWATFYNALIKCTSMAVWVRIAVCPLTLQIRTDSDRKVHPDGRKFVGLACPVETSEEYKLSAGYNLLVDLQLVDESTRLAENSVHIAGQLAADS